MSPILYRKEITLQGQEWKKKTSLHQFKKINKNTI